jgi:hypothetical protein
MRLAFIGIALAAATLTACDSGEVPSPTERDQAAQRPVSAVVENLVNLRGDGLVAGAEAFYFAAGRSEVEGAAARALGEATGRSSNAECGAGPVDFTDFPGGLALHFQDDRLVGWNWRLPQDGDARSKGTVQLSGGEVQLGSTRALTQQSSGFARLSASTLGEEFTLGASIGGFFDSNAVSMLYAGTQCFFR